MVNSRTWLHVSLYSGLGIAVILAADNVVHSINSVFTDWTLIALPACLISGFMIWQKIDHKPVLVEPISRVGLQEKLQQVNGIITKISDADSCQNLQQQAAQIANNLAQNQFRIAVFGTSSAGKTSVINALLGRTVGQTAATNGTTLTEQAYTYEPQSKPTEVLTSKPKLSRQISLIDTPGILEKGEAGAARELLAQQIAKSADLLVFVTATDLTATEYSYLASLAELGKRIILAFNKTDCYLPNDLQSILAQLQARTAKFFSPLDIVAIAAQPNPIKVRQYANQSEQELIKEWLEPIPADVQPLKERIESILSGEWEQLFMTNTALRIQSLQETAQSALQGMRRTEAEQLITKFQWANAATVFANPLPGLDVLASAAINTQMLIELSKLYEKPLSLKQAQKTAPIIAETLLKFGCVEAATVAIATCLKTNALTYAIGGSVQGISAAYLTYIGGTSFVSYLEQEPATTGKAKNMNTALRELCLSKFNSAQSGQFFTDFVGNAVTQINGNLSSLKISASSR